MDTIRVFAQYIQEFPLVFFLILVLPYMAITRVTGLSLESFLEKTIWFFAIGVLILFFGTFIYYLLGIGQIDHVSPTIVAITYKFINELPMYPLGNQGEVYSFMYGPLIYLINSFYFKLLPDTFFCLKIPGAINFLITLICFWITVRKNSNKAIYLIVFFSYLLFFDHYAYWIMGDSFLLTFCSISVAAMSINNKKVSYFILWLLIGLIVNIKAHAFLYIIPLIVLCHEKFRIPKGYFFLGGLLSLLVFSLPFFNNLISFEQYVYWLEQAAGHGIVLENVLGSLLYLIFFSFPFLFSSKNNFKKAKYTYITFSVVLIFINIIGSKHGSSAGHHTLPIFLFFVFLLTDLSDQKESFGGIYFPGFLAVLLINSLLVCSLMISKIRYSHQRAEKVALELFEIRSLYNGTISMGYGGGTSYDKTYYRSFFQFNGEKPIILEAPILMDWARSGDVVFPTETIDLIENCASEYWVLPKGEEPFSQKTWFLPHRSLFSEKFRGSFAHSYTLEKSFTEFDVYKCK